MAQKLDAQGGTGGSVWDDGYNHEDVTRIFVGSVGEGIRSVSFQYLTGRRITQGSLHGGDNVDDTGILTDFKIFHPNEYLVSVEGWYQSIIKGIQFKTNYRTSSVIGNDFDSEDTKFSLQVEDMKIIGFHGSAGTYLDSIGAYFVPKPEAPITN